MEVSEGGTVTVNATSAVAAFSPHYSEAGTVEKYKGPNGTVGAVAVDSHGATHINPKNVYQKPKYPTVTDMAGGLFLLLRTNWNYRACCRKPRRCDVHRRHDKQDGRACRGHCGGWRRDLR